MTKQETCLAIWSTANNRQYWDRSDDCRSMWLSLRVVETEGEEIDITVYGGDAKVCLNLGVRVWSHTTYPVQIELAGHDIYSATPCELVALAKWIEKANKKIAKADIPTTFGVKETLMLTLRAVGVKNAVVIDPDWSKKARYKVVPVEEGLALANYADALAEMERVRLGEEKC